MIELPPSPYLYTIWSTPTERKTSVLYTADQMREAILAERERCAQIAEQDAANRHEFARMAGERIAAAIRATSRNEGEKT